MGRRLPVQQRNDTNPVQQALIALGLPFVHDSQWDTVEVGGYTVWPWATSSPYAVYGGGDFLPRWQFDNLPALLDFLHRNVCRAA
jgi:hypothetical protein